MSNSLDKSPLLLYVHIPKTGGTSFTQSIIHHCPKFVYYFEVACHYEAFIAALNEADALCGHFPFGIHRFTNRSCQYITLLRDPVEQIISFFYFKYRNLESLDCNMGLSLDDFIHDPHFDPEYVNLQTRFISGELSSVTPNLQQAKKNLLSHFSFVGITEMYAESQFLFTKEMNWELHSSPRLNTTQHRLLRQQVSPETLKLIILKNKLDIELYRFAVQLLSKRVHALSPALKKKLNQYKLSNS